MSNNSALKRHGGRKNTIERNAIHSARSRVIGRANITAGARNG